METADVDGQSGVGAFLKLVVADDVKAAAYFLSDLVPEGLDPIFALLHSAVSHVDDFSDGVILFTYRRQRFGMLSLLVDFHKTHNRMHLLAPFLKDKRLSLKCLSTSTPEQRRHDEAVTLYPFVSRWRSELYDAGKVSACDFVAAYVLAFLAIRTKSSWCGGLIPKDHALETQEETHAVVRSARVATFPGLVDLLHRPTLEHIFGSGAPGTLLLATIFSTVTLKGPSSNPKNYINNCFVNWFRGLRPLVLMFSIPGSLTVLRQQSRGTRVVSCLCSSVSQLASLHESPLVYQSASSLHARDALEFTLHDLAHIEHFTDPLTHFGQVGFFDCLLALNGGRPPLFFSSRGYDKRLWHLLEYVASDMNSHVIPLLKYLKSKWLAVAKAVLSASSDYGEGVGGGDEAGDAPTPAVVSAEFEKHWEELMDEFGVDETAWGAAREGMRGLCLRRVRGEELKEIERFFVLRGKEKVRGDGATFATSVSPSLDSNK